MSESRSLAIARTALALLSLMLAGLTISATSAAANDGVKFDATRIQDVFAKSELPPGSTHRLCQAACAYDDDCEAWTFVRERVTNKGVDFQLGSRFRIVLGGEQKPEPPQCLLSSTATQARADDCCITGVRFDRLVGHRGREQNRCAAYADRAVAQHEVNLDRRCGFDGPRWNANLERHRKWCLKVSAEQSVTEEQDRIWKLRDCKQTEASVERLCRRYADSATAQSEFSKRIGCDMSGGRWHTNRDRHMRNCLRTSGQESDRILERRETALGRCIALNDTKRNRKQARNNDAGRGRESRSTHFENPERWSTAFGYSAGWLTSQHPRHLTDVNGDGRADVVGFGDGGVYVALSHGDSFGLPKLAVAAFGTATGGWKIDRHPRLISDVNGDGAADLIGFADNGVYVSLNNGRRFTDAELWSSAYRSEGWSMARHVRTLADVDGDGRSDIVGFADSGVYVSLSRGRKFTKPKQWSDAYGASGWNLQRHARFLIDVDGDSRADVVGIHDNGTWVSLSTGKGFAKPKKWSGLTAPSANNSLADSPRLLADVNGDGLPDLIAMNPRAVRVGLNIEGRTFSKPEPWSDDFTTRAGWGPQHVRTAADVDGDGRADIVAVADAGVYYGLSNGKSFGNATPDIKAFGTQAGGWNISYHPRTLADVNGDGQLDIIGFADNGVMVSLAR